MPVGLRSQRGGSWVREHPACSTVVVMLARMKAPRAAGRGQPADPLRHHWGVCVLPLRKTDTGKWEKRALLSLPAMHRPAHVPIVQPQGQPAGNGKASLQSPAPVLQSGRRLGEAGGAAGREINNWHRWKVHFFFLKDGRKPKTPSCKREID